jgi:hypothetical protein
MRFISVFGYELMMRMSKQKSPCLGPDLISVLDEMIPAPLKIAMGE